MEGKCKKVRFFFTILKYNIAIERQTTKLQKATK